VEDLPGAGVDLAAHKERDQCVDGSLEVILPSDEVILVTSV